MERGTINTDRVRAAMDSRGWDQATLSAHSHVNQASISRLLVSGSAHGSTVKAIALALGVSTDYLYGIDRDRDGIIPDVFEFFRGKEPAVQRKVLAVGRVVADDPAFPLVDEREAACVG